MTQNGANEEILVVCGGLATPDRLIDAVDVHLGVPGLTGFSVQSEAGKTIAELAAAGKLRNKSISVTTINSLVVAARRSGFEIKVVKSPGQGYHATVVTPLPLPEPLAEALSSVFEQMPNASYYNKP